MNNKFLIQLVELLDNFRLEGALKLSDKIHKAELEGYELSKRENKYWMELTAMIEQDRKY